MSFLESLLHELQDQLVPAESALSAGQVAASPTSEGLNVTLPAGIMSRLKQQALQEGRSCSSLATFLIEDGLRRHIVIR